MTVQLVQKEISFLKTDLFIFNAQNLLQHKLSGLAQ